MAKRDNTDKINPAAEAPVIVAADVPAPDAPVPDAYVPDAHAPDAPPPAVVAPPEAPAVSAIRDQPNKADLIAAAKRAAGRGRDYVHAQVVAKGARMWDPEHSQWIESDSPEVATHSDWLKRQVEVGKIKLVDLTKPKSVE